MTVIGLVAVFADDFGRVSPAWGMLMRLTDATRMKERLQGWRAALATRTAAFASSLSALLSGATLIGVAGLTAIAVGAPGGPGAPLRSTAVPIASQRVKAINVAPSPSQTTTLSQPLSRREPVPSNQTVAVPPAETPKAPGPTPLLAQKTDGTQQHQSATPPAPDAWSSDEVMAARHDCARQLAPLHATVKVMPPIKLGQCGAPAPVSMRAVGLSKVELQPPVITTCGMVVALHTWIDSFVQPVAKDVFGSPVVRIIGGPSYACRNRNNQADGPISEHAFANAIDISGFLLENGRTITVLRGWGATVRDQTSGNGSEATKKSVPSSQLVLPGCAQHLAAPVGAAPSVSPAPTAPAVPTTPTLLPVGTDECRFLRRLHQAACGIFSTVLGPEANDFHRNHFHFDLKARKSRAFCE